jgi:phosphate-induced protein 1
VYGDTVIPNGDMGADTITDDTTHELSETVTDPNGTAWYTKSGEEDADLCNFIYSSSASPVYKGRIAPGSLSLQLYRSHGSRYLIQFLWKNIGIGFCAAR